MDRAGTLRRLSAALLLCAACDVTLPWRDGSVPDAPRDFHATYVAFDGAYLTWSEQAGVDGWELEWRVAGGPWESIAGYRAGPTVWWVPLADLPELAVCAFRIRAVAGARCSGWAETQALHGIRQPTEVVAQGASGSGGTNGPITVRWTNASTVATDVRVERKLRDLPYDPWIEIAGATLAAGSVLDPAVEEGVAYSYRVRVGANGVWSGAAETWTDVIAMQAPYAISAEMVATGVRVSWAGHSTAATGTWIWASSDGILSGAATVDLAGTAAAEWVHAPLPLWPTMQYRVAFHDAYRWASSEWTGVAPFALAGPPALAASATALPIATFVTREPSGGFHLVAPAGYPDYQVKVQRATATGHESHVLADVRSVIEPGVLLDAAGNPHVAYERSTASWAVSEIVHEWWDGAQWDAEVVRTDARLRTASFALGSAGALHLVYERDVPPYPLVHLVREGTTNTETLLPPEPITSFSQSSHAFAAGPDGTAVVALEGYVIAGGTDAIVVATRTPDGIWSDDPVPIGTTYVSRLEVAAGGGGDVAIAYSDGGATDDVWVIRRLGGVWSAPEHVLSRPWMGGWDTVALAASADLEKLVLSATANYRTQLFVRGPTGWEGLEIGPSAPRAWVGIGTGGAWALYRNDTYTTSGPIAYSLFVEKP
jgi:hypothetical protein